MTNKYKWKLCSNCGNPPLETPNHTLLCETCHKELLPEIWESRPLEDELHREVAMAEALLAKTYYMCERLIEAGNRCSDLLFYCWSGEGSDAPLAMNGWSDLTDEWEAR